MARNLGWKMVVDSEQGRRLGAAAGGGGRRWEGRRTVSADPHSGLYPVCMTNWQFVFGAGTGIDRGGDCVAF